MPLISPSPGVGSKLRCFLWYTRLARVQASGKGALRDDEGEMVAEPTAALIAPSVTTVHGPRVESEMLKFGIVPVKPPSRAAVKVDQIWTELEEPEDISQALQPDAQEMLWLLV